MPKKKSDDAAAVERFERALRKALNTPPEKPAKAKRPGRKPSRKRKPL